MSTNGKPDIEIVIGANKVKTKSQVEKDLRKILDEINKEQYFSNGTRVERYSLQRCDGQIPYASKKVVILSENSPLRRLNLDKFELTKEKVREFGDDEVAPGLKKTLKLFNKNGEVMFEGTGSIRQFMKSVAHIIRK